MFRFHSAYRQFSHTRMRTHQAVTRSRACLSAAAWNFFTVRLLRLSFVLYPVFNCYFPRNVKYTLACLWSLDWALSLTFSLQVFAFCSEVFCKIFNIIKASEWYSAVESVTMVIVITTSLSVSLELIRARMTCKQSLRLSASHLTITTDNDIDIWNADPKKQRVWACVCKLDSYNRFRWYDGFSQAKPQASLHDLYKLYLYKFMCKHD